jgi:hypothetical protein
MSAYDSRPDTWAHISRVRHFLSVAIRNLHYRSDRHDKTKLEPPEVEGFDIATPKLAGMEYGSEEYKQSLRDLGPTLAHHFEHNDHHPEHFQNGVVGMSLMALIEMLCDWRAASERVKQRADGDEYLKRSFAEGLAFNQQRFGYGDELAQVLMNTAIELGLVDAASRPDGTDTAAVFDAAHPTKEEGT